MHGTKHTYYYVLSTTNEALSDKHKRQIRCNEQKKTDTNKYSSMRSFSATLEALNK